MKRYELWGDAIEVAEGLWCRWADVEAELTALLQSTRGAVRVHEGGRAAEDVVASVVVTVMGLVVKADALTADNARLRALLTRIVKYASEDRASTPGFTRLARALAEASETLGGAP